ncbi:MAG: hypothetical protein IBJ11_06730 [Phycisphaerales bacterium]|nr:hypothetical protein [Phycisphaerales bacterium]
MQIRPLALAALAGLAFAGSALASGLTRDPGDVTTNNSSAFGIGSSGSALTGGFGYGSSPGWFSNVNPTGSAKPFQNANTSSGDACLYTDFITPASSTSYRSLMSSGSTTVSQLNAFRWYINNPSAGGARIAPNGSASGAATGYTESYSGGNAVITMNNIGTSTWGVNMKVETFLTEGAGNGQANVYARATLTRISRSFGDGAPITLGLGSFVDLDVVTVASNTASIVTNTSAEKRMKITAGNGIDFGEVVGYGSNISSFGTGLAYGSGSIDATLAGSGALANSAVSNSTNTAAGLLWSVTLNAVGDSAVVEMAFSLNQSAIPTPGTAALFGLAGLVGLRRRR